VILEGHSPYAAGGGRRPERPYGASLWSRWPEFGLYLSPEGHLRHWRGARDERDWPAALERGGTWPWTPVTRPRDVLWARIAEVCAEQFSGDRPSSRDLASLLGESQSEPPAFPLVRGIIGSSDSRKVSHQGKTAGQRGESPATPSGWTGTSPGSRPPGGTPAPDGTGVTPDSEWRTQLAARAVEAQQRRARRTAARAELDRRRRVGIARRHAAKLRHQHHGSSDDNQ
jgi:hypothetical protein